MKKMDYLYDDREILEELIKENEEFDLADFYLKMNCKSAFEVMFGGRDYTVPDGAVSLITPSQMLSFYSWQYHKDALENVMGVIYKDFNNAFFAESDFEEIAVSFGDVCIQLCALFAFVWVPDVVNEFQYNALVDFALEAKKVNDERVNRGLKPIDYATNVSVNGKCLDLADALPFIKNRISENVLEKEELIIESGKSFVK